MATALARIEAAADEAATTDLLDAAWHGARAQVIGLTGPPGVGKSTLIARLIEALRAEERSVGVIAIDPSSRRSGGALLGDRVRLALDAEDPGVFVRSMAARGRLGGLAADALAATLLMRAVYDRVIVETVGVGQSETDIARRHVQWFLYRRTRWLTTTIQNRRASHSFAVRRHPVPARYHHG
jgi:LAO/AO transport system kinase